MFLFHFVIIQYSSRHNMGRHSTESKRAYRNKKKEKKEKKKNILSRGNLICNVAPSDSMKSVPSMTSISNNSQSTSFSLSHTDKLLCSSPSDQTMTSESTDNRVDNCKVSQLQSEDSNEQKPQARGSSKVKRKYFSDPFCCWIARI